MYLARQLAAALFSLGQSSTYPSKHEGIIGEVWAKGFQAGGRSSHVCCTRVSSQSIPVPGSIPRNENPEYFKPDYFLVNM